MCVNAQSADGGDLRGIRWKVERQVREKATITKICADVYGQSRCYKVKEKITKKENYFKRKTSAR